MSAAELSELNEAATELARWESVLKRIAPKAGAWHHVLLQASGDVGHWSRRIRNVVALSDRP